MQAMLIFHVAKTTHFRENEGNYGIPGDGWHPLAQGHSKANPHQLHRAQEEHLGWHRVENNVELQGVGKVQLHQGKRELCFAYFSCHKTKLNWSNLTTTLVFWFSSSLSCLSSWGFDLAYGLVVATITDWFGVCILDLTKVIALHHDVSSLTRCFWLAAWNTGFTRNSCGTEGCLAKLIEEKWSN